MSRNVIDDGYTEAGYIAAVERLHDALDFRFRPMLYDEAEVFCRPEFQRLTPAEARATVARAVTGHLAEWSEVDAEGQPRPITAEVVGRLRYTVLNRLLNIIAGLTPADATARQADAKNSATG